MTLQYYIPSTEWKLAHAEAMVDFSVFEQIGLYSHVHFTVTLERKPLHYVMNMIVPCIMLSLIMLFVQFLPSTSGEKLSNYEY